MTGAQIHLSSYPRQLQIARRAEADSVELIVSGEIDLASAPVFERELRDAEGLARHVVVDFAGLEFIDSSGIHVLIDAQQRADTKGQKILLRHVPAHAQRLFGLVGISEWFSIELEEPPRPTSATDAGSAG